MSPEPKNILSRFLFSPLSLLLLVLVIYADYGRGRWVFVPDLYPVEFTSLWYPLLEFISAQWRGGEIPLWSHRLFSGFPVAGFPHAAVFYPPVLIFALLRFTLAFPLFIFFHHLLRVIFMFGLLREWGSSRFTTWLVSGIYVLSGTSMHLTGHLQMFTTLSWLPGLLWLALRVWRHGGVGNWLGLAAVFALNFLAGEVETLLYAALTFLAFFLVVEKFEWQRLFLLLSAWGLGLLLVAGPLLNTLNYLAHSYRATFSAAAASHPEQTLYLFFFSWFYFTGFAADAQKLWWYLGLLPWLGFIGTLSDRSSRRFLFFLLGLALVVSLYVADLWPVVYLKSIPPLRFAATDMSFRALFPFFLLFLLCSARGFELWQAGGARISRWLLAASLIIFLPVQSLLLKAEAHLGAENILLASRVLFLGVVILLSGWLVVQWRQKKTCSIPQFCFVLLLFFDLFLLDLVAVPRAKPEVLERPFRREFLQQPAPQDRLYLLSLFVNDPLLWRMYRLNEGPGFVGAFLRNGLREHAELLKRLNDPVPHAFETTAIREETRPLLNFLGVRWVLSHQAPFESYDNFPLASPFLKSSFLIAGKYQGPWPKFENHQFSLPPNSTWKVKLHLFPGDELETDLSPREAISHLQVEIEEVATSRRLSLNFLAEGAGPKPPRVRFALPVAKEGDYYLNFARSSEVGEELILRAPVIRNPQRPFLKVFDDGHLQLYENRQSLDKYGLYTQARRVSAAEAKSLLFSPDRFDPRRELLIGSEVPPVSEGTDHRLRGRGQVEIVEYKENRVRLKARTESPAYLSIAESFYPGWRAWINGREVRLFRANYAYQVIPLTAAGDHEVELRFLPQEFRLGLFVSLASALAFFLQLARVWSRRFRSRST